MADDIDIANEIRERALAANLRAATRAPFVAGEAGECIACERWSPRLVGKRCARCRDGRRR